MQKVREAEGTLATLRGAALMAGALERRTCTRTALVDDLVSKFITHLQVTCLDLPWEPETPLADHFNSLFAWLTNVFEENRYFVAQWHFLPSDCYVHSSPCSIRAASFDSHDLAQSLSSSFRQAVVGLPAQLEPAPLLLDRIARNRSFQHQDQPTCRYKSSWRCASATSSSRT